MASYRAMAVEARAGIEPACTDLQSAASPLRHRAIRVSTQYVGGGGRSIQERSRACNFQIAKFPLQEAEPIGHRSGAGPRDHRPGALRYKGVPSCGFGPHGAKNQIASANG